MILDNIKNIQCYKLPEVLNEVVNFIKNSKDKDVGRYEMNDGIYVLIQEYNTFTIKECDLENHKRYVDLQYVIDGVETIGIAYAGTSKIPYDESKDIEFFYGKDFFVETHKGDFALLFPQDYHRPRLGNGSFVKKAVVKIPLDLFK